MLNNDHLQYLRDHPAALELLTEIIRQDLDEDQLRNLLSLVPDNIAEEEFLESCAMDCRCEEPYQIPCAGVTAGGLCDDMRYDDQQSSDDYDDQEFSYE